MDDLLEPAYGAHYTIMMLLSHGYGPEMSAAGRLVRVNSTV